MAKISTVFVCSNCGQESPKWFGKCTGCNAWNTCYEEKLQKSAKTSSKAKGETLKPTSLKEIENNEITRIQSGFGEVDRVLGGGFVKGM